MKFWDLLKRWGVLFLLLSVAALHCASRINLVTADLGRHLKNGALFLAGQGIPGTNLYSYTFPDLATVCHHWDAGVLFELVNRTGGFGALSLFYVGILLLTFWVFFHVAEHLAGFWIAVLACVLALPLIGYRTEIRPEGLTAFFLGIELLILTLHRDGKIHAGWLWTCPVLLFVWANSHIFFVWGLLLIFLFLAEERLVGGFGPRAKMLGKILLASGAACMISPTGLALIFSPSSLFREYGYMLAENQSVLFMMGRFPEAVIYKYLLGMVLFVLSLLLWRWCGERDRRRMFLPVMLALVFGGMALGMVRMAALFGFIFIPISAGTWQALVERRSQGLRFFFRKATAVLACCLILLALTVPYFFLSPIRKFSPFLSPQEARYRNSFFYVLGHPDLWTGLVPGVNGSADFMKTAGLQGPIFNNYDIGGYLIYHFFPAHRVFVDNRPEAYPAKFLKDVYIRMQEDEKVWRQVDGEYGFQLIFFYRRDMTPWAQPFLIRRLQDRSWAPIFADDQTIILARRGGVNQPAIDRYEMPAEMFRVEAR